MTAKKLSIVVTQAAAVSRLQRKRRLSDIEPSSSPVRTGTSPYVGQVAKLYFEGAVFQVPLSIIPNGILEEYPALASEVNAIAISGLEERHGHTIIHFLHTGAYQYLEPSEAALKNKETRFKDTLRVYEFATRHEIVSLTTEAFIQIKALGEDFKFSKIFIMINELEFDLCDKKKKFVEYLNKRVSLSAETVTREEINEVKKVVSSNEILSIILLGMLEMKLSLQKHE